MLDRLHAIRSLTSKLALGVAVASTFALAACGTTSTSTGTSTSTSTTTKTCKVSSTDLASTVTTSGTATKVDGLSGQKLAIDGSSALAPLFSAAKASFDSVNGTETTVTPNGSGTGLKDANAGAVAIGMSDVFASEKEANPGDYASLTDHQVAAVVFTLVTSSDLSGKVSNLTKDQIKQIFTGNILNWKQVGGPDEPITLITRPSSSGTRATFKKFVLDGALESGTALKDETSGSLIAAIKATPGSIGYVSLSFIAQYATDVNPLCIDGAKAVAADVNSGKYNFWGIEHAYTKGPATGAAKEFLKYILSDQVQKNDLLKLNYLPLSTVSASAVTAHTVAGAPAPETLS